MLQDQNATDFKEQLEKVIDIDLMFSPTPREAAQIAIPDTSDLHSKWVREYAEKLGISNIRTIFKLHRIADRLIDILNEYDERLLRKSIHSACLFGFSLYQPGDAPPVEYITTDNRYLFLNAIDDKEKKTRGYKMV